MPIIQIYQAGQKIETIEFDNDFFIFNDVGQADVLQWESGENRPNDNQDFPLNDSGRVHIWLVGGNSSAYHLSFRWISTIPSERKST